MGPDAITHAVGLHSLNHLGSRLETRPFVTCACLCDWADVCRVVGLSVLAVYKARQQITQQ